MKKCFIFKLSLFSVQIQAVVSEGERECAPVLWIFYLQESNSETDFRVLSSQVE